MLKKSIITALIFAVLFTTKAYCLEFKIFEMRNKIFEQSKEIKSLMEGSKDQGILLAMFDSCLISTTQLDAYFFMLNIFEGIKKEEVTQAGCDWIINWLNEIKRTAELNRQNLSNTSAAMHKETKAQMEKLRGIYTELNKRIDSEMNKILIIRRAARLKKTP